MSDRALDKAQAILNKYTAQEQQAPEAVPQQTVPVEESAIPPIEPIPFVEPAPAQIVQEQQQVVSQTVEARLQAMQEQLDKAEHAYSSLQGKYNKELPDARNGFARLQTENDLLKDQLYNKQASQVETPAVPVGLKERLGQDKVDELGENYVEMTDNAIQYQIKQSLELQESESAQKLEALQKQLDQDKWSRYNESVARQIPNFVSLVDPLGDGRIDVGFEQFLREKFILPAFEDADINMDVNVISQICNMYNDSKTPAVQAPVQAQHNPKAQAVAPPTTNTSAPQLQPQTPAYAYNVSDFLKTANLFNNRKISEAQWLTFDKKYNQAVAEGKVNFTA